MPKKRGNKQVTSEIKADDTKEPSISAADLGATGDTSKESADRKPDAGPVGATKPSVEQVAGSRGRGRKMKKPDQEQENTKESDVQKPLLAAVGATGDTQASRKELAGRKPGAGPVGATKPSVEQVPAPEVSQKQPEKAIDIEKQKKNDSRGRGRKTKKTDQEQENTKETNVQKPLLVDIGPPTKKEPVKNALLAVDHRENGGLKPPLRKDFGKRGRPIILSANHFLVNFDSNARIYHYDIEIRPEMKANKRFKKEIIEEIMKTYSAVFSHVKCVFDGEKNLYSNHPIPTIDHREKVFDIDMSKENEKIRSFTVAIKKAAEVSLKDVQAFLKGKRRECPQNAIQALDIVFRHLPSLQFVSIGRSLYPDPDHGYDLGGGAEMWRGYYQSLRPGKWKDLLQLNLDVSNRSFYKAQPALEFAVDFFKLRTVDELYSLPPRRWDSFSKEIKGVRIEVTHNPNARRKYRLIGIGKPASEHRFDVEKDGKMTNFTTEKYFAFVYNYKLRHAILPTLQAQPSAKNTFLPMEVCIILAGQQSKKLTDMQTATMIRQTALPAPERRLEIMKLFKGANLNHDSCVKGFGVSVVNEMMRVTGRVLPPPLLQLKLNKEVRPRDGVWDFTAGAQFYEDAGLTNWGLIIHPDCRTRPDQIDWFCKELIKTGREIGVSLAAPAFSRKVPPRCNLHNEFTQFVSQKVQLVMVVLPFVNTPFYAIFVADIVIDNAGALLAAPEKRVHVNLVNEAKKRLISRSLVFQKPVIILGADVNHPAAGESRRPSIAAIVGSMDSNAQRYSAKICVQNTRQEVITNLKDKVRELLVEFYRATKHKPVRIIFYRDGVGEGQFYEVLSNELVAIRAACGSLEANYQPLITFLVVQKRHHTRLFCEDNKDAIGRSKNIPPGTVVDTMIIHPAENDFFLCSHQGIQGTSRPAHYHVLWDDNDFHADDLHQLTYELCHTYVRCPRSVSIPAPAYYAHLAAFRARKHLELVQEKLDRSGVDLDLFMKQMEAAVQINNSASQMYFV
uniref:Uncharacterized protein n=1 Tax=Strigamia maritima TaxID=126957 RepID=T1JA38_STRMM